MVRAYIAGPMTGISLFNYPAFHAKAAELRALGWHVVNPVENGLPADARWEDHMREDIRSMMSCDTIYLLPGWKKSRGATLELHIAEKLGFAVVYGGIE